MISQSSFGTRLDNAKKIAIHVSTFAGYNPPAELSITAISDFLAGLETHNADSANKAEAYAIAVDTRRKAFKVGDTSLTEMASNILAAIRGQYGNGSRQAAAVKIIVARLKGKPGAKTPKPPPMQETPPAPTPPVTDTTADADPKSISRRETGFGNMLKTFGDIVGAIKNYATTYTPASPLLTTDALVARFAELSAINRNVTVTYTAIKQSRFERLELYVQLADTVQRIKNTVKGQYGGKSMEFILIKGIKV